MRCMRALSAELDAQCVACPAVHGMDLPPEVDALSDLPADVDTMTEELTEEESESPAAQPCRRVGRARQVQKPGINKHAKQAKKPGIQKNAKQAKKPGIKKNAKQAKKGGRACWEKCGAYRLWSHVCRHTPNCCMKTCAVLQLRCSASHYTSQSLCLASTLAFWSEPPGGASYKVCPCGPGRDTRILLLQRRPHAVAQYSDSHTSNMLVHIFTRR